MVNNFPVKGNLPELKDSSSQKDAIHVLKIEYILQRYLDVWKIIKSYPFLKINGDKVKEYFNDIETFSVFGEGILFQNISSKEFKRRVITSLAGPGLTGGISAKGELIVNGQANPNAFGYLQFNDILIIGGKCLFSSGTRFQVIDGQKAFQYEIGELITVNKKSQPRSDIIDFTKICELKKLFRDEYINGCKSINNDGVKKLYKLLYEVFNENVRILDEIFKYHLKQDTQIPKFNYTPPEITKYGRLTHSVTTYSPQIEYNLSLLHYEKAIIEFDQLKKSVVQNDYDYSLLHGIYCIIALAACMESIANILFHKSKGNFRTFRDKGTPIEIINSEVKSILASEGKSFIMLDKSSEEFKSIEEVRKLRNIFMHYIEKSHDVDLTKGISVQMISISEENCRNHLKNVRRGIEFIFNQLPNIPAPIVTSSKVTRLGDYEVP